jgi:hypothetical protein
MASEERLKVLKMVQEGKISAEDAIELLSILEEGRRRPPMPPTPPTPPGMSKRDNRWLRVRVTDTSTGKTRVNVRLPIGMVSAGVKMGMRFAPNVEGVDPEQLMDFIQSGEIGQIVDVYNDEDGEHVEVYIE